MNEKMKCIADEHGYEYQSRQLIEEMAELTQAINKHWRNANEDTFNHIVEEIADVEICLVQIKYLLNVDPSGLAAWKHYKVVREMDRLNGREEIDTSEGWKSQMMSRFMRKE